MPSTSELENALRNAVKQLWDNGESDQITVNRVRKSVESELDLDAGFFTTDEWNRKSRDIVKKTVEEMDNESEADQSDDEPPQKPAAGNKRKAPASSKSDSKRSKKATSDDESQSEPEKEQEQEQEAADDSDMSSVIDEPPARKRGSKASAPKSKGPKTSGSSTSGSADQQEVKKLQQQLGKCGVRKVWGVELKAYGDDDKAKVRHLKKMLSDVGMTGRFSDARAKEIKEQRELMADLQDVQAMDRSWGASEDGARSTRSSRRAAPKSLKIQKQVIEGLSDDSEEDDDDEEEEEKPKRKKQKNADSDDDDHDSDDDDDDDASASAGASEEESSEAEMTEESEDDSYGRNKKKKGGARQRKRAAVDSDDSDEDYD